MHSILHRQLNRTEDGGFGNLQPKYRAYTIDPTTRYTHISTKIDYNQAMQMYDTDEPGDILKFFKCTSL